MSWFSSESAVTLHQGIEKREVDKYLVFISYLMSQNHGATNRRFELDGESGGLFEQLFRNL